MIVCRRPGMVFDVDVIGLVALGVIVAAAWVGVLAPMRANATELRALHARIDAASEKTVQTNSRLHKVNMEAATLERGITERLHDAPGPSALTPFLHRVAALAELYGVELEQMVPRPAQQVGGCAAADIRFSGHGAVPAFLRLLDQLWREVPYIALQELTISGAADPALSGSTICWTLRLHMPGDSGAVPDVRPGPAPGQDAPRAPMPAAMGVRP